MNDDFGVELPLCSEYRQKGKSEKAVRCRYIWSRFAMKVIEVSQVERYVY